MGQARFATSLENLTPQLTHGQNLPNTVQTIRSQWFKVVVEEPAMADADTCVCVESPVEAMCGMPITVKLAFQRNMRYVTPTPEDMKQVQVTAEPMLDIR